MAGESRDGSRGVCSLRVEAGREGERERVTEKPSDARAQVGGGISEFPVCRRVYTHTEKYILAVCMHIYGLCHERNHVCHVRTRRSETKCVYR